MSNSISGGISFSGIGSGTDFTEVVDQLLEVESYRLYNLEDSREVAYEAYEAMSELISTIGESQEALSLLNNPSKFLLKLASSSAETVATALADADAVDGTFTVDVQQLASNAIWASKSTYASKTTNIATADTEFSYTYKGETHTIDVPKNTTLEGLAYMINNDKSNPGVKMEIISTSSGYAFQLAGTESGQDASLQVHANNSIIGFEGNNSKWESYTNISGSTPIHGGSIAETGYGYDIYIEGRATPLEIKSPAYNVNGDTTYQELANYINAEAGSNIASFSDGKLKVAGMTGMTTTGTGNLESTVVQPTMTSTFTGPLDSNIANGTYIFKVPGANPGDPEEEIQVVIDGSSGSKTLADLFTKLTNDPKGDKIGIDTSYDGTTTTMNFTGVSSVDSMLALGGDTGPTYSYATTATAADAIQENVVPHEFQMTLTHDSGVDIIVDLNNGMDFDAVVAAINAQSTTQGFGNIASIASGKLAIDDVNGVRTNSPDFENLTNFGGDVISSGNWTIQESQDAMFTLNNFDHVITSSTNEVTGVIEGVTLSLKDEGKAQITVASDTDSVKANIQTVLDSINAIILKVQDLTAVTEEPDSLYSEDGSVTAAALNGEYSVNSFLSRFKSEVNGTPPGFNSITGDDIFSGDFVALLAHMGIKTDSNVDSATFGLFAIAPEGSIAEMQALDQELFDEALANNMQDVINFFAADDSGTTSSGDFGYANHIDGITEPGTYDVKYTVNADGSAEVYINGTRANRSSATSNTYTVGGSGPEQGMSITLYDLDRVDDAGNVIEHTGTVSIQRGLVPSLESFLQSEMKFTTPNINDPSLSEDNGGLKIAQYNYQELIDSIDTQISAESDRLDVWEYNQRMKYARLDTLLGEYNNNMASLESQLGQLG